MARQLFHATLDPFAFGGATQQKAMQERARMLREAQAARDNAAKKAAEAKKEMNGAVITPDAK